MKWKTIQLSIQLEGGFPFSFFLSRATFLLFKLNGFLLRFTQKLRRQMKKVARATKKAEWKSALRQEKAIGKSRSRSKILKLINNSRRKFLKKSIFNQYLEIGERLQPNFANCNLDFLPKYRWVWEASSNTRKCSFSDFWIQTSWLKKLGCASYFQPVCLYLEIRVGTLTCVWTIT